jgi:hypothetical protein
VQLGDLGSLIVHDLLKLADPLTQDGFHLDHGPIFHGPASLQGRSLDRIGRLFLFGIAPGDDLGSHGWMSHLGGNPYAAFFAATAAARCRFSLSSFGFSTFRSSMQDCNDSMSPMIVSRRSEL